MAQGCLAWCTGMMNIKNKYFNAIKAYAELEPELVWTSLEPVSSHPAFAQANKSSSSDKDTPTLPIEDPIMEA